MTRKATHFFIIILFPLLIAGTFFFLAKSVTAKLTSEDSKEIMQCRKMYRLQIKESNKIYANAIKEANEAYKIVIASAKELLSGELVDDLKSSAKENKKSARLKAIDAAKLLKEAAFQEYYICKEEVK